MNPLLLLVWMPVESSLIVIMCVTERSFFLADLSHLFFPSVVSPYEDGVNLKVLAGQG